MHVSMLGNRSLRRRSSSDAADKPPKRLAIGNVGDQEKPTVVPPETDDHPEKDDDDDDEDDEEKIERELKEMRTALEKAHGSKYTKATVGKTMKKPAASIIDPKAKPVIKRPAMAHLAPKQPPLRKRFEAIHYNGCRIYWGGDRQYRVLTVHKKATKNFTWQSEEAAGCVWHAVIAYCDNYAGA